MYSPADLPSSSRAAPAKKRRLSEQTGSSSFAYVSGLPTFCDSSSASSSVCSSMASASFSSASARSAGVVSSHSGRADFAASTALSTSVWEPRGTSAIVSPVEGFSTSIVAPSTASTHSPPMKFLRCETVTLISTSRSRPEPAYREPSSPDSWVSRCEITTGITVRTITTKTTAFTIGSCWPRWMLSRMKIGSVVCAPAVNVVKITSSNESANASSPPDTRAVESTGHGPTRLSLGGAGSARLRLAFTATELQEAPGALPSSVPPFHGRAAAQAGLGGVALPVQERDFNGRLRLRRRVQEAFDVLHALHLARLAHELVDQLRRVDLAAQDDLAVLGVDVDLPLRDVRLAEDLRLDLACERHVVGLRLGLLAQVGRLLLERVGLRDGPADESPAVPAENRREPVGRDLAAALAVVGIEEVGEAGAEGDQSEAPHLSRPSRSRVSGSRGSRPPHAPRRARLRYVAPRSGQPARRRPSSPRAEPAPRS